MIAWRQRTRPGAPAAAGQLGDERKRAFLGPEVREAQRLVGVEDDPQRDVREIMPLGDHLSADQDVDLTRAEPAQHPLKISQVPHGVAIDATDPGSGKVFYTQEIKRNGSAVEFRDGKTGGVVTLQNSEILQLTPQAYKAAVAPPEKK